jgi:hypothetical protein
MLKQNCRCDFQQVSGLREKRSELETPSAREDIDMEIFLVLEPSYALQSAPHVREHVSKFVS